MGFTLAELLAVIAIIAVLVGLASIAASSLLAALRQNKLDTIAQDIYVTAQNRLTEMYTDNRADQISVAQLTKTGGSTAGLYTMAVDNGAVKPSDWEPTITYAGLDAMYNKQAPAADILLPEGALQPEVAGNHWIIEYNADYGYIYAVYYSEDAFAPADVAQWHTGGKANTYRDYAGRKGSGVGYYGGGGVLGGKVAMTATSLNVSIKMINAEELKAELTVIVPTEYKDRPVRLSFTFEGETSGNVSNSSTVLYSTDGFFTRQYTMVMDSFNSSGTKSLQFGNQQLFNDMYPGENVTMRVKAELGIQAGSFSPDTGLDTADATVSFNSLFQSLDTETGTASISAGRHLQNLNHISPDLTIPHVVQTGSIDFKGTTPDNDDDKVFWWAETYPGRAFEPITKSDLRTFTGSSPDPTDETKTNYYIINGMTVKESDGPMGMFAVLGSDGALTEIKDVSLVGTTANGAESVGALAGQSLGSIRLTHTGAYLERDDYSNKTYTSILTYLKSSTLVGGLIGEVQGDVDADGCYSAQVLRGGAIGGLFGRVDGTMTLKRSYSDCYMSTINRGRVAGFATNCGGSSTIDTCYAAGFTLGHPVSSAGFVPEVIQSVSNSYSVLNIGPEDPKAIGITTIFYPTAAPGTPASNVYYAVPEEVEYDSLLQDGVGVKKTFSQLRGKNASKYLTGFLTSGETTAYNLAPGMGLTSYPYLYIKLEDGTALHHYGDWDGNLFEPGTLVYFEEYTDSSGHIRRGYYGAGSNYLDSSDNITILRDGYALLYSVDSVEKDPYYGTTSAATVSFYGQSLPVPVIDPNSTECKYSVIKTSISGGNVETYYYFRDISPEFLNKTNAPSNGFYTKITVTTPDTKDDENPGVSYYYFNPRFAATVQQVDYDGAPAPSLYKAAKNTVRIRTPRQLYLLSRDYDLHYDALHSGVTVNQEMHLDYGRYQWTSAGFDAAVTQQDSISDGAHPFRATYNGGGHRITGLDILSDSLYTGLFGSVADGGSLRNIVLADNVIITGSTAATRYFGFQSAPNAANDYAYAGALAGYNAGNIENCAVAGYQLVTSSYKTTLYAGGLVGYNARSIRNSSADTYGITVETNDNNASLGAFVGNNAGSGVISNAYALGNIQVTRSSTGKVLVSGFAGSNAGTIQNSYTICATSVSNIDKENVDGFTTDGGRVLNCKYLTKGTYRFNRINVRSLSQSTKSDAKEVTRFSDLTDLGSAFDRAAYSSYHTATSSAGGENYPFPTSVKNEDDFVHFGDWITSDVFGNTGMLYWELETNGANNGLHFYLVDENGSSFSTLCTAHDDGGIITKYGYGYYHLDDAAYADMKPRFTGLSGQNRDNRDNRDTSVEAELEAQFAGSYKFILYKTSDAFSGDLDGLYVAPGDYNNINHYATATYNSRTYSFNPFFGATLNMGNAAPTEMQIRSMDQLQFLNWNQKTQNNSTLSSKDTYRYFTYLGQASVLKPQNNNYQTKGSANNRDVFDWSWIQTHDIRQTEGSISFTPIAAAGTSSSWNQYNATLYAWFGSTYNGNSYKIEDVSIISSAYTVGLFGVTAGADMQNIIMYSTKDASITRTSHYTDPDDEDSTLGAYSLGGLIGVAYDYNNPNDNKSIKNCAIAGYKIIDNSSNQLGLGEVNIGGLVGVSNGDMDSCSAVTEIQINCTHVGFNRGYHTAKYGNFIRVGGLTGATLGKVSNCYTGGEISVGGSTLTENVNDEGYFVGLDGKDSKGNKKGVVVSYDPGDKAPATMKGVSSTSIYIAGIGGSGFAQNYMNFYGQQGHREGSPTYINCYTYMKFPRLTGTIRSISAIGSLADRYKEGINAGKTITITNCYYLSDYAIPSVILPQATDSDAPNFTYSGGVGNILNTMKNTVDGTDYYYFYEMLNGTSRCENKVFHNENRGSANGTPTAETIGQMPNLTESLGSSWSRVSNMEYGVEVVGKYSFPGSDHQLDGRDYPFPTTVKQDIYNVHYGTWPKGSGLYSSDFSIAMDLLIDGEDTRDVTLTYYKDYAIQTIDLDALSLKFTELTADGVQDVDTSAYVSVSMANQPDNTVQLTITGVKEGTTTITASYGGDTAIILVTVNADFTIEATPVTVVTDETGAITAVTPVEDLSAIPTAYQWDDLYWKLTAKNSKDAPLPLTHDNWRIEADGYDENYDLFSFSTAATGDVLLQYRSNKTGEHTVQATAYNVMGASGQIISGVRTREIKFTVLDNPPAVELFAYPREFEKNERMLTLYYVADENGNFRFCTDKAGTDPVSQVAIPVNVPIGYDGFMGYILPGEDSDSTGIPFTDSLGNISQDFPMDPDQKTISVYGMWSMSNYELRFYKGRDSVTVSGEGITAPVPPEVEEGTEAPALPDAILRYTTKTSVTLPTVEPPRLTDASGREQVFCGWQVNSADAIASWPVGQFYGGGAYMGTGLYGNADLTAVWKNVYSITYLQSDAEDAPAYEGVDAQYTSYIGDFSHIRLYTPASPDADGNVFVGWKLKASDTTLTGWQENRLYDGTITPAEGESYTGDVTLVAQWHTGYKLTFVTGEGEEEKEYSTATYAQDGLIRFPTGLTAETGQQFIGWKIVEPLEEGATRWNTETLYRGEILNDNSDAEGYYAGNVKLRAQWEAASYTIDFVLELPEGHDETGTLQVDSIKYTPGAVIELPRINALKEFNFGHWTITAMGASASWDNTIPYANGQRIETGNTLYGNITMTGSWTPIEYQIRLDTNGGTIEGMEPDDAGYYWLTYNHRDGFTLPMVTLEGETLDTWKQDGAIINDTFGELGWKAGTLHKGPTGNVLLKIYVQPKEYTITYQNPDGTEYVKPQIYKSADSLKLADLPTDAPTGYTYTGWYVTEDTASADWAVDTAYTGERGTGIRENVTLQYRQVPIQYTITYSQLNVTPDATQSYTIDQTFNLLTAADMVLNESKEVQHFSGWKATDGEDIWTQNPLYTNSQEIQGNTGHFGDVNMEAQYSVNKLTLQAASADFSETFTEHGTLGADGEVIIDGSSFESYFGNGFTAPSRGNKWTLLGWYSGTTKVLEPNGEIAEGLTDFAGIVSGGKLAVTGEQTLRAGWRRIGKLFTATDNFAESTVIAREVNGSLFVLTMNGSDITVTTVSNESGNYYWDSPNGLTDDNIVWNVTSNGGSYSFQAGTDGNKYYLSRNYSDGWKLRSDNGYSTNCDWLVSNNRIYFQYTFLFWQFNSYLTLNSNVSLSETSSQVSFYTLVDPEVVYD